MKECVKCTKQTIFIHEMTQIYKDQFPKTANNEGVDEHHNEASMIFGW